MLKAFTSLRQTQTIFKGWSLSVGSLSDILSIILYDRVLYYIITHCSTNLSILHHTEILHDARHIKVGDTLYSEIGFFYFTIMIIYYILRDTILRMSNMPKS